METKQWEISKMRMATRLTLPLFMFIAISNPLAAHDGASGATKARMDAMSNMGRALKPLSQAARNDALLNNSEMEKHIAVLRQISETLPELFMMQEIPPISEALPKIWDDPEGFGDSIAIYASAINKLNTAYDTGDSSAAKAALREVTRSCGDCHQAFRKQK